MSERKTHDEARQISDRTNAARKAARQGVVDRNEAAHREAKKRRKAFDEMRASLRPKSS